MEHFRPLGRALGAIAVVLVIGTVGYWIIEGWPFLDGLYMTIITITTIGFKEVHDLSVKGEIFTIFLIFCGMGVVGYVMLTGAKLLVEGEVINILTRRRSMKAISKISDHFIICGFGRMGSFVCRELHDRSIPFVVVEQKPEIQDAIMEQGYLLSPGDATSEDVLTAAGIGRARGLVSLLDSDASNVYVVLSARRLNPDLLIIARAGDESAEPKLEWAGANRVISPYRIGGMRLVMGILKPMVMNFLEVAMDHRELDIDIQEAPVAEDSPYAGKALMDTNIRRELNLIIISIIKPGGEMVFNPGPTTIIGANDTLIAMGKLSDLERFTKLAGVVTGS